MMMNGCNIWRRNRRGVHVIIRQELLNSSCAAKMILEGYLSSHRVNNDPASICDKPGKREQHVLSSVRAERARLMFSRYNRLSCDTKKFLFLFWRNVFLGSKTPVGGGYLL